MRFLFPLLFVPALALGQNFIEPPMLRLDVSTGRLPPTEKRLPQPPLVVRMDQPYRGYALDLLTAQKFPADKTPYEPYDDVAWALPFGLGGTKWEVLLGVRNLFRDPNDPASMYDELLVVRPPKRVVGGFLVRF